jgi:hypothetical protein
VTHDEAIRYLRRAADDPWPRGRPLWSARDRTAIKRVLRELALLRQKGK